MQIQFKTFTITHHFYQRDLHRQNHICQPQQPRLMKRLRYLNIKLEDKNLRYLQIMHQRHHFYQSLDCMYQLPWPRLQKKLSTNYAPAAPFLSKLRLHVPAPVAQAAEKVKISKY